MPKKERRKRPHWKSLYEETLQALRQTVAARDYWQGVARQDNRRVIELLEQYCNRPAFYLAGPMSGVPLHNKPFFNQLARRLGEDLDLRVLNPAMTDGGSTNKTRSFYLGTALDMVRKSAGVICMADWQESPGARLEVQMARELGKPVMVLLDDKWWETRDRVVKE